MPIKPNLIKPGANFRKAREKYGVARGTFPFSFKIYDPPKTRLQKEQMNTLAKPTTAQGLRRWVHEINKAVKKNIKETFVDDKYVKLAREMKKKDRDYRDASIKIWNELHKLKIPKEEYRKILPKTIAVSLKRGGYGLEEITEALFFIPEGSAHTIPMTDKIAEDILGNLFYTKAEIKEAFQKSKRRHYLMTLE